jgi:D-alanyl-D-alanine carboxypeptidase (penicillin-binding protein 5/6)
MPLSKPPSRKKRILSVLLLLIIVAYCIAVLRPQTSALSPSITFATKQTNGSTASLDWPASSESAIGAVGYGVLATHSNQTPVPTASTIKLLTALTVLKAKPLAVGQKTTPLITISAADVATYNSYVAEDGSVVPVVAGEQISEYQALQALLLPSANNMADTLSEWAYGSLSSFTTAANSYADQLGMQNTKISDASGFSPATVSTAQDMVLLAQAALNNPVISDIVAQPSAVIPLGDSTGTVTNVNTLLGKDDIIGLKTGNTDQAGGCFIGAARYSIDGHTITVISAVMDAPNLNTALTLSQPLLASAKTDFQTTTLVPAGQVLGAYKAAWGQPVSITTANALQVFGWIGTSYATTNHINSIIAPEPAQYQVGNVSVKTSSQTYTTAALLTHSLPGPSLWWRFTHPKF